MTPEEIERTMEFILQQQAKNEVEIQNLKESVKELRESIREQGERMEAGFAETRWAIVKILEASEENKAITTQLAKLAVQTSRLAKASEKTLNSD